MRSLEISLWLPLIGQGNRTGDLEIVMTPAGRWLATQCAWYGPAGDLWSNLSVRGFKNRLIFDAGTSIEAIQESSFPGYTGVSFSWAPPSPIPANQSVILSADQRLFAVSGDPAGEVLAGIYILSGLGGILLGGASLLPPINLANGQIVPLRFSVG